jgi:uncharacterized peroxidase-related enzyme
MPTNFELAFAERPEIYAAWVQLNTSIKARMDLRRYELATFAAAQRLRSSYCCLAHAAVIMQNLDDSMLAIARDYHDADLSELDVAIMDFAVRVVDDATSIGDSDRQPLRDLGLAEDEIMDVVLAATARCFFSKTLDALGVLADARFREFEPELREALVVGRSIAES